MSSHRGSHPEDDQQFAQSQLPRLRDAVFDLSWLRSRGYGDDASIKLVGDRYHLKRRQRNAVARSACSDEEKQRRLAHQRDIDQLDNRWVDIDGFNVLISVEGALGGAYLFIGRDNAYRDVNPVRGTYRIVEETEGAIRRVRDVLTEGKVKGVTWWLDAHVSNIGRLQQRLDKLAPSSMGWEMSVQEEVDAALMESARIVATSDSTILDEVEAWCSIEHLVCSSLGDGPNVRDLRPSREVVL